MESVTDLWFRSRLPLADIARKLGLQDVTGDAENYWAWVIGTLGEIRLDITRTHTRPARMVDTRVFVLHGEFTESLLSEVVERLRAFVPGVIHCGQWVHRVGDEFDQVIVRKFVPTGNAADTEPGAAPDRGGG
jgi:hypothetical protein